MSRCSSLRSRSTRLVYGRGRGEGLRRLVPALLPVVLVGGLALDGGGYGATTWGWSTLAPLAVVVFTFAAGLPRRPPRLALSLVGLLAAFCGWTWLSLVWSSDLAQSVLEGERLLVYLSGAAAFLLLRREEAPRLLGGLLAAIALACSWALAERAFGGAGAYDVGSAAPDAARRLAAPLGYSNGLGVFAAVGIILAGGFSVRGRGLASRAAAGASLLLLVPTLTFTYSRGAWLALVAGGAAGLALARPRVPRTVALGMAAAAVAGVALLLVRVGGPSGLYHSFSRAAPTVKANESRRLLSLSGSSRAQYWHAAWRQYEARPWLGAGAGSYQRWWLRHRPAPLPVRDAHSLYLETLAELGPLGLALLVAALAVPIAASWRARAEPLAPLAFGGYVAYLVHAAQDWDWELPAVTLAGLACGVAVLLLAERRPRVAPTVRLRLAGAAVGVGLAVAAAGALVGNAAIVSAAGALDRDNATHAASDARAAERWAPWSPEPWRLRGEAQLSQGDVEAARRSFEAGLDKDPRDWELWLDLGLASSGARRRFALARATRLNPLAPELAQLVRPGG